MGCQSDFGGGYRIKKVPKVTKDEPMMWNRWEVSHSDFGGGKGNWINQLHLNAPFSVRGLFIVCNFISEVLEA